MRETRLLGILKPWLLGIAVACLAWATAAVAVAGIEDLVLTEQPDGAFLGVHLEAGDRQHEDGLRIVGIEPDSAADVAGLMPGDTIVSFDEASIWRISDLTNALAVRSPGDAATATILRRDEEQTFSVTLGRRESRFLLELPRGDYYIKSPNVRGQINGTLGIARKNLERTFLCEGADCRFTFGDARWYRADCLGRGCERYEISFYDRPMIGVQIAHATAELRRHLGGDGDAGMLVSKVFEGSPAERDGIAVGDLIVAIQGRSVEDERDVSRVIRNRAGSTVDVDVIRDGRPLKLDVYLPEMPGN